MIDQSYFEITKEIEIAIKENQPIVALESTLISHGLPYPKNLEVAQSCIEKVRKYGSIPATIAIINGKIKIGLNDKDLKILSQNTNIEKVSIHNLSLSINNNKHAATTVASTTYIASKIGIKFLATGGIGGVHRDVNNSFDISGDLIQLSKNNMIVICSGAKSILDIDKTFEMLETLGIPRIGYKTDYMPGFWYRETKNLVDHNYKNINKLVNYLITRDKIGEKNSVLIFNPVSHNKNLDSKLIEKWIKKSNKKAIQNSIKGKYLTPFLISEINSLSDNKTLEANEKLIVDNASLASKLAYNFYKI